MEKAKNICLVIAVLLLLMAFTVNGATQQATAAGIVIVEESGGKVTDFRGKPPTVSSTEVIASNGHIHELLLELMK